GDYSRPCASSSLPMARSGYAISSNSTSPTPFISSTCITPDSTSSSYASSSSTAISEDSTDKRNYGGKNSIRGTSKRLSTRPPHSSPRTQKTERTRAGKSRTS